MKKISQVLLLFLAVMAFGQKEAVNFETTTFKEILAKAKSENKLIFLDAYTSWCGPCKMMAKKVFTQKEVGDYYNTHFINARFDMEKGEGKDIAKKYEVYSYPTYLFLNGDGEVIHRSVGYFAPKEFIDLGETAVNPEKQYKVMKERFEKGDRNPDFLFKLAEVSAMAEPGFFPQVTEAYFKAKKTKTYSKDEAMLLVGSISKVGDQYYQKFVEDKTELSKTLTPEGYQKVDNGIKMREVMAKAFDRKTLAVNDKIYLSEAEKFLGKEKAEQSLSALKMEIAFYQKDYKKYVELALKVYKNPENFESGQLNEIAWNFFEKVDDKAGLEKALEWAKVSVKKSEEYANTDTLANLYHKLGDDKNAKIWAEKSIELGKKEDEDTSSTEKLLKSLK
ncbi:thioredoxin family protein [Riemerella columbipharyngis]|uniref:Thioredoxin n=1 Tax=Riemerella columbipharyngis TaxID=1071918 RepID=A0A1G6ZLJ4_9FLAO|nr:thioredoxin fold domain-containing protein [Riemerella columbipharyngis]SDE03518.1 Thioredoxin [Riemerella columbipharyngis]